MILSDIATYVTDKISSENITLEEYVTTDSLLQNKRGRCNAQNLPPVACSLTHFREGDILVANIRPYLKKIWLADTEGGCSADVLVFRAKEGHSSEYLHAVLLQDAFFSYAMKGAKGSKMPRGDKDQIMRFPIHRVSPSDEPRIGNIIHSLNKKIELNTALNHYLEEMLNLITSRLIFSSESLEKKKIGEIAEIKAGGDCPNIFSKKKTNDCQIPIYSNGIENRGLYGFTNKSVINRRCVTVAARGTIGHCERRLYPFVPVIRLLSLIPIDEGGDVYLHQVISGMTFKKNGSVQQQLTVPEISCMEIPYPNKEILKLYNDITSPIIHSIEQNISDLEMITSLRDELLSLLMTGQVSVMQLNNDLANG